jgi:hypothetical protein
MEGQILVEVRRQPGETFDTAAEAYNAGWIYELIIPHLP